MVSHVGQQPLPVISTLRVDFVPQREMAIRKWYSGSSHWFYHRRALPGDFDFSRRLFQLIDPQLRAVCRLLHRHGIHTTPSCQGHFHERAHFKQIWDSLQRDEELIRAEGLEVRDSTDGRPFLFRASTYELPWEQFDSFYDQAAAEQTRGYLGVLLPRHRHDIVCELHNRPFDTERVSIRFDGQLSCLLNASVFGIVAHPSDGDDGHLLWTKVAEYFYGLLSQRRPSQSFVTSRLAP